MVLKKKRVSLHVEIEQPLAERLRRLMLLRGWSKRMAVTKLLEDGLGKMGLAK